MGVPYVAGMWNGESGPNVLGIRTLGDDLLAAIAPLGLAAAAGSALVVDLDPAGPSYPSERTVAELTVDGPRRSDLVPARSGVAVIGNGGADLAAALDLVGALAPGWPAVVLRVGDFPVPYPVVPVQPLWPGWLTPAGSGAAVWQSTGMKAEPPAPGPVLPPPGRPTVAALMAGQRPLRSRWVRAWARVWELPWR